MVAKLHEPQTKIELEQNSDMTEVLINSTMTMTPTSSKAKFGATKFDLQSLEDIQSVSTIQWK